jgi:acetyl-CoA carboxylase biotin carboxyl carrier protein
VTPITSPVTGNIWKLTSAVGDEVVEGQQLLILESMKMEFPLEAPHAGVVATITVAEGDNVAEGDHLLSLD